MRKSRPLAPLPFHPLRHRQHLARERPAEPQLVGSVQDELAHEPLHPPAAARALHMPVLTYIHMEWSRHTPREDADDYR